MGINFEQLNNTLKNKDAGEAKIKETKGVKESTTLNENAIALLKENKQELDNAIKEAVKKINMIEKELSSDVFLEMEDEIEMLLLAFMSGTNAFLQGPAGTAKSELTETLSKRITNSKYFRLLVGRTTEPAEIFGPTSLKSLKNDVIRYNTENKLPTSDIVFLDETFKCSSAVLNSLLTAMNEKLFFNDVVEKLPLISLIGASNEYPDESSLIALYDRFLFRYPRRYIAESNKRIDMFKMFIEKRQAGSLLNDIAAVDTSTKIDIQEIRLLIEASKEVKVPLKVLKSYNNLLLEVQSKQNIVISDRRKNEALKAIQALALKRGLDTVTVSEFEALKYILWEREEDIHPINNIINKIANPNLIIINEYKTILATIKEELTFEDNSSSSNTSEYMINKTIKIAEAKQQLATAKSFIESNLQKIKPGTRDHSDFSELLYKVNELQEIIKKELTL